MGVFTRDAVLVAEGRVRLPHNSPPSARTVLS
jgi:hypothetical protein